MEREFTEIELRELEKQLSCPKGEYGIEVGRNMNETNAGMILDSIGVLGLQDGNKVMELGHGNCGHLNSLLSAAENVNYFGLEVSATMQKEAEKGNPTKLAKFKLYNGLEIPFDDNFFDRTMSVNSIYFWSDREKLIKEIERTLKPNCYCVLTFVDKDFMKKIPFVGEKFKLFDKNEIQKLIKMTNMRIMEYKHKTELVKSNTGKQVERKYTIVKMQKASS